MISDAVKDIIAPCLWGAAINSLDLEADKFLIIERVLEHGGDRQIEFVLATFKREDIIYVVQHSSYLSLRTVNYWCLFFNLKKAEKNTLVAMINNVRFSLFNYPYPLLKPLVIKPDCCIKLASPEDIAAMKLVAIAQRGSAKDFVDLNALIRTFGLTLDYLISQVQKKYGVSEEYGYQVKRGLVYFDDAVRGLGDVTVIRNGKQVRLDIGEWHQIEEFYKKLIYSHMPYKRKKS